MSEIINLRQRRKAKARAERETEAAANRALFGRTRAERESEAETARRAREHLDGHLRQPSPDSPASDTATRPTREGR